MPKAYIELETLMKDIQDNVIFTVRDGVELPTAEMRGANKVIDRIKSQPIISISDVDAVQVVRCKDCKYSSLIKSCSKYECNKGCGALKFSNDFCSYGERKEDNNG